MICGKENLYLCMCSILYCISRLLIFLTCRDLKPANLLIKTDVPLDGTEETDWKTHAIGEMTLVVGDFGLGRHLPAQRASNQSEYTLTANTGTFGYMAPEVAKDTLTNNKGKFNEKADIYSIGAIIYEMATGEKPKVNLGNT